VHERASRIQRRPSESREDRRWAYGVGLDVRRVRRREGSLREVMRLSGVGVGVGVDAGRPQRVLANETADERTLPSWVSAAEVVVAWSEREGFEELMR
jgi:hypothetical protein